MKDFKVVICGCGKMGRVIIQYLLKLGANIVGVFDHNKKVGLDLGDICNNEKIGIYIQDIENLENFLKENEVDICIVATKSLLKDVYEIFYTCACSGVNVISICEEAFYPQNSSSELMSKLDVLAKKNNCTICGTGYQDVAWGYLITTIAGSLFGITKIKGYSSYNVEDYGMALAEAHGVGMNLEQFKEEFSMHLPDEKQKYLIENGDLKPSYRWNTNGWLASKLGLSIISQIQYNKPIIANDDLHSNTLGVTIKKSDVIGMSAVVNTKTEEGIEIEFECIGKVYEENEKDKYSFTIYGEDEEELITITIPEPQTVNRTCATLINRIPDVINAKAGFVTTDKMNAPMYYVNKDKEKTKKYSI